MKTNTIIIIILCVILVLIIYNLYKKDNQKDIQNINYDDDYDDIEHFGVLNNLKKKNKNNKKNKKNDDDANANNNIKSNSLDFKKNFKSLKSKKSGVTFDDLLTATEGMDPETISLASMQKELSNYRKSFSKEKFSNNSKNTAEAFEKFALYKDKFFEIFK
jgi:hypothetical protein